MVIENLQDSGNDNWSEQMLVNFANLGARQIAAFVPQANVVIESVKMVPGARQTIEASGLRFLRVIRNMGTDGVTPGNGIIDVGSSIGILNVFNRNWMNETPSAEIWDCAGDDESDMIFWVSPPADGTSYVEVEYSKVPAPVVWDAGGVWESAPAPLANDYLGALMDYILYRAYEQDSDFPGNLQRASMCKDAYHHATGFSITQGQEEE